ncbi:MAG: tetratricopeptide (TPR) repeat protein [Arcticibacterium sp.]|jgi:tetratricopeptide (TPR) repeat protein
MKRIMKTLLFGLSMVMLFATQGNGQSVQDGLRELNAERYISAEKIFSGLAKTTPTEENYFQLGRYYLSSPNAKNNLDKALAAFDAGNALDKRGNPLNTIGLAMVQIAKEDIAGAKLLIESVIGKGRGSRDSELIYRAAEGYTLFDWSNDPAEAVMLIDLALDVKKIDNPEYFVIRAQAFDIKNEGGDVMNALRNAERLGAKDKASIYSSMAKIWLQGKNYPEAKDAIEKSIAADIEHAPAYYYLSSLEQTFQNWKAAAEAAQNYLKYGDGDCAAQLRYTKLAFTGKDFENVLAQANKIENCSTDPIIYRLKGISKFELGQLDEAITDLTKYVGMAEEEEIFGLDYGFQGRAYLAMDDEINMELNDSMAIMNIEKAISMKDTTFDYYSELARYFQEKKKYPKAIQFISKSIVGKKKVPATVLWNLGTLQYTTRDYAAADTTFEKVCGIYKDGWAPPYLMSARAKIYKDRTDTTFIASEKYEKYISLIPDENKASNASNLSEAYGYLAQKEFAINKDIVAATALLDELLKYDPTNEQAINLRNSINGVVPEEEIMEEVIPEDSGR